jgi:16S rRNA (adenine1518-N6/adenine1519-N6)-dimethyltransferase
MSSSPHRHKKRFGQHFLHDDNIIRKLLRAVGPEPGQPFIEIGPGEGALTLPLLAQCGALTAIELDRDLIERLQRKAGAVGELRLIQADVLEVDLAALELPTPWRVVGNLPYNISTPLMFHLLQWADRIADMHFMVQKEVAQRIIAGPGSKHYGRLSVMIQYHCETEYLFAVPPGCFTPPPKVDSAIIRLRPHARPPFPVRDVDRLARLLQAAFGQRRKTIGNSLKGLIGRERLQALGIDPKLRAENLSPQQYSRMANDQEYLP